MRTLTLISLLVSCALISACRSTDTSDSSAVQQSEIHQAYEIEFGHNRMTISASFRFGGDTGTTLALSLPSKVTCNGKEMKQNKRLFGGTYYGIENETYQPESSFVFTDTSGQVYSNSISLTAIEFTTPPATLSRSKKNAITLSRVITDSDEKLRIQLATPDGKLVEAQVFAAPAGNQVYFDRAANAVILEAEFFKDVKEGNGTLTIEISKRKPLDQGTHLGGYLNAHYVGKAAAVVVEP